MSQGYLELILGPMFSGKTTRLVELYNEYQLQNKNVLVINYTSDKRYHDTMLSTHDKIMIPCLFTDNLMKLLDNNDYSISLRNADVILINEGQFFPDLIESISLYVEDYYKIVHICGLDGDFCRNKFGNLLDLIPYCDKVTKLHSICTKCKSNAIFSHRITDETSQIVIGSTNYIPLCRGCYRIEYKHSMELHKI